MVSVAEPGSWLFLLVLTAAALSAKADTVPVNAKFKNLCKEPMELWSIEWAGAPARQMHVLNEETETSGTVCYTGSWFYYTKVGSTQEIKRYEIKRDQVLYPIVCEDSDAELVKNLEDERKFQVEYFSRTGEHWWSYWPRDKPKYPIWDTSQKVREFIIPPKYSYYNCLQAVGCQHFNEVMKLKIELMAEKPRLFLVKNFLNNFEIAHMIGLGTGHVHQSTVGDGKNAKVDHTRTSQNTWIERDRSAVTEAIFQRMSTILKYPEEDMWIDKGAESIQLVHYTNGAQYAPHWDWGITGQSSQRFITFLMYLTNTNDGGGNEGGETEFPQGTSLDGGRLKIQPGAGSGAFFYNMLPDGNADYHSLHASLPTTKGEKWLCNIWLWDPEFGQKQPRHPQSVTFANDAAFEVQLWWKNPDGDDAPMSKLPAGQDITFSSYAGHQFYWTVPGSKKRLQKLTVKDKVGKYKFLPNYKTAPTAKPQRRKPKKEGSMQRTRYKPPPAGQADDLVGDLALLRTQNTKMRNELQDLRNQVKSLAKDKGRRLKLPTLDSSTLSSHMWVTVIFAGLAGTLAIGLAYRWVTQRRRSRSRRS